MCRIFLALSRITLGQAIVFIPFRYAWISLERPYPPIYKGYTNFELYTSDLFLFASLCLWLVYLAICGSRLVAGPIFLWLPVTGFAGLGLLSTVYSGQPALTLVHALRLFLLAGFFLYLVNEVQPDRSLDFIFPAVALQLFIQSISGVAQVLEQKSLGLSALGEHELDPAWSGVSIVWAAGIRSLRAYGLADHPNILGGCLAFALLVILLWNVRAEERWQALIAGLFVLGSIALLLTFSRSAWLAFLSGLILMVALFLKKHAGLAAGKTLRLLAAGFIVSLPFLWVWAPAIGIRLNWQGSFRQVPQENQSIGERALINAAVMEIVEEHPLIGVGLGALPFALLERNPDLPVNVQPAHLVLLDAAAELGLPGALLYLIISVGPWLALWVHRKRLVFTPALTGVSALLLAVTVVGFFDYYTWLLAPGRLWQWLAWGLWGAVYRSSISGGCACKQAA
jgi:O-antigen ligase